MARPTKTGLDYFPLDVHLSDEVYSVECAHGNDGFAAIIKAWQALYQTNDGTLDCSGVLRRKTLAKRANVSEELWENIIETCVEAGIFDKESWESGKILTSNGVKKRLQKVLYEREEGRKRAKNRGSESSSPKNPRKTPESENENESESEEEREAPTKKTSSLENPGFSDQFMDKVWPYYLKVGKSRYKNRESQEVALRQLYKWAKGNELEAVEALAYAVACSYQGFQWYFAHKKEGRLNDTGTTPDEFREILGWIKTNPGLRRASG